MANAKLRNLLASFTLMVAATCVAEFGGLTPRSDGAATTAGPLAADFARARYDRIVVKTSEFSDLKAAANPHFVTDPNRIRACVTLLSSIPVTWGTVTWGMEWDRLPDGHLIFERNGRAQRDFGYWEWEDEENSPFLQEDGLLSTLSVSVPKAQWTALLNILGLRLNDPAPNLQPTPAATEPSSFRASGRPIGPTATHKPADRLGRSARGTER